MKRRDWMKVGAAVAVSEAMFVSGCKAERTKTSAAAAPLGSEPAALAASLGPCIEEGELCLTHCLRQLGQGDRTLADCAASVRDMLAVCRAVQSLVASNSPHVAEAAALCAAVCQTCRVECAKHASHHSECAACERACARTVAAARVVAGA